MTERFVNAFKAYASALDVSHGQPRLAIVTSVDPATYAARVKLQPEDVQTGWLPIKSAWVGAGWGLVSPPSVGDQVLVMPQEGDAEHGIIVGHLYSDQQRAPSGGTPGELWLVHKSGSFFKLKNDGTIQIKGDVHVDGNLFTTKDVKATGEVVAKDGGSSVHLSTHLHQNAGGTGLSGTPQPGS